MGTDDYTAAPIGGGLKLKGVKDASVSKHKKKRKRPKPVNESENETQNDGRDAEEKNVASGERTLEEMAVEANGGEGKAEGEGEAPGRGKTEAERRHEEARRKRLDERLKREGLKTHKERVEELNRYLSNLSEHHDMYVHVLSGLLKEYPFSGKLRAAGGPEWPLDWEIWRNAIEAVADVCFYRPRIGPG
ncbi:hypothetical protein MMC08_007230 [Hypocenomyce scalaris]|nr:hypothetical protein [Hypocenomyce scalaris]